MRLFIGKNRIIKEQKRVSETYSISSPARKPHIKKFITFRKQITNYLQLSVCVIEYFFILLKQQILNYFNTLNSSETTVK